MSDKSFRLQLLAEVEKAGEGGAVLEELTIATSRISIDRRCFTPKSKHD